MRSLSVLLPCLLVACAHSSTPGWDGRFGDAVGAALALQIIDAGAARNTDPVAGLDGRAARAAFERYQKTLSEAAPQPASLLGAAGR